MKRLKFSVLVGIVGGPFGAVNGWWMGATFGLVSGWLAADQFRRCPSRNKIFKTQPAFARSPHLMKLILLALVLWAFVGCAARRSGHYNGNNIWFAINDNNPAAVRRCLRSGASPNTHDQAGWSLLHEACWIRAPKVVEILLESGADGNATADNPCVKKFEAMWRDIPHFEPKIWPATRHATPLHTIISSGGGEDESPARIRIIRLLLAHGANTNIKSRDGFTVTALAAKEDPQLLSLFQ